MYSPENKYQTVCVCVCVCVSSVFALALGHVCVCVCVYVCLQHVRACLRSVVHFHTWLSSFESPQRRFKHSELFILRLCWTCALVHAPQRTFVYQLMSFTLLCMLRQQAAACFCEIVVGLKRLSSDENVVVSDQHLGSLCVMIRIRWG